MIAVLNQNIEELRDELEQHKTRASSKPTSKAKPRQRSVDEHLIKHDLKTNPHLMDISTMSPVVMDSAANNLS